MTLALLLLPVAILWLLPLLSDALSMLVRLAWPPRASAGPPPGPSRLLFLVPAHDEGPRIARTVASITALRGGRVGVDLVVIADNCADDTAPRAEAAGARVLVRRAPDRPGKPAAIGWALQQLALDGVEAVVIVDADTTLEPRFAEGLLAEAPLREQVVQAHFGSANPGDSWLTRLGSLLEDVRYLGQFPLKRAAGLNVVLTGNGMCIGSGVLSRHPWAVESLTEDLELYLRYTLAGERITFAAGARLLAEEARDLAAARVQRRRWQAGRARLLVGALRAPWRASGVRARQRLDLLAELAFPGPVVHGAVALLGGLLVLGGDTLPRVTGGMFLFSLLPTLGWTTWALVRRPDRLRLLLDLLHLPPYAVWRVVTAVTALVAGPRRWERSPRDPE